MSSSPVVREAQTVDSYNASVKQKAAAKLSRIPVKVEPGEILKKPDWIRVRAGSPTTRFYEIKQILREQFLMLLLDERAAVNAIPSMLATNPDLATRMKGKLDRMIELVGVHSKIARARGCPRC